MPAALPTADEPGNANQNTGSEMDESPHKHPPLVDHAVLAEKLAGANLTSTRSGVDDSPWGDSID